MKATIRKATLLRDGEECLIWNEYDNYEYLTVIQDEVPEDERDNTVLCINKDKLIQIVHKDDLQFRKNDYEQVKINEDWTIDYDLDADGFELMYDIEIGVYIHETNNY